MKYLLLFIALVGCEDASKAILPTASEEANGITYVKDKRTGLCFAVSSFSTYPIGSANVFSSAPCTPEVEKLAITR